MKTIEEIVALLDKIIADEGYEAREAARNEDNYYIGVASGSSQTAHYIKDFLIGENHGS